MKNISVHHHVLIFLLTTKLINFFIVETSVLLFLEDKFIFSKYDTEIPIFNRNLIIKYELCTRSLFYFVMYELFWKGFGYFFKNPPSKLGKIIKKVSQD